MVNKPKDAAGKLMVQTMMHLANELHMMHQKIDAIGLKLEAFGLAEPDEPKKEEAQ